MRRLAHLALAALMACHAPPAPAQSHGTADPDTTGGPPVSRPYAPRSASLLASGIPAPTRVTITPVKPRTPPVAPPAPTPAGESVALCCDVPSGLCCLAEDGGDCAAETSERVDCPTVSAREVDHTLSLYVCAD